MAQREALIFYRNLDYIQKKSGLRIKDIAHICGINYKTLLKRKSRNTDLYYRFGDHIASRLGISKHQLFFEPMEDTGKEVHMFVNKNYYFDLIADHRYYDIDFHESLRKICNILNQAKADIYMEEGMIRVDSHYHKAYVRNSSSSFIKINPNARSQEYIHKNEMWAMLDEEQLIFYLVRQINLHFPAIKSQRHYKEIFLYHFIYGESFKEMKRKYHYKGNYKYFLKDKEKVMEYAADAFRLWNDLSWLKQRMQVSEVEK